MIEEKYSCLRQVSKTVHIALPSAYVWNEVAGVTEILESWKRQYVEQLKGVVVNYKNVSLTSNAGIITIDKPFVHYDVKAIFYLFCPTIGSIVKGKINRISREHIGCLVHGTINVTIYLSDETSEEVCAFISLDHEILFQITHFDFQRKVIRVKGDITPECVQLMKEMYPDFSSPELDDQLSGTQNSEFDPSVTISSVPTPSKTKKRKREKLLSDANSPASSFGIYSSSLIDNNTSPLKSSVSFSGGDVTSDSLLSPLNKSLNISTTLPGVNIWDTSNYLDLPSTDSSAVSTVSKKKKAKGTEKELTPKNLNKNSYLKSTSHNKNIFSNFITNNSSDTRNILLNKDEDLSSDSLLSPATKKSKKNVKHLSTETAELDPADYFSSLYNDSHLLETDVSDFLLPSPKKKKLKKSKSKHSSESVSENSEVQNLLLNANENTLLTDRLLSPVKYDSSSNEDNCGSSSQSSPSKAKEKLNSLLNAETSTNILDTQPVLHETDSSSHKPVTSSSLLSATRKRKKSKESKLVHSVNKMLNENSYSDSDLEDNENKVSLTCGIASQSSSKEKRRLNFSSNAETSSVTLSLDAQLVAHKKEPSFSKSVTSSTFLSKTKVSKQSKSAKSVNKALNESNSGSESESKETKMSPVVQHNISSIQNDMSNSEDDQLSESLLTPYVTKPKSKVSDVKSEQKKHTFVDTQVILNDSSTYTTKSSAKKFKKSKEGSDKKKEHKGKLKSSKHMKKNKLLNLNLKCDTGSDMKTSKKKVKKLKENQTTVKEPESIVDESSPLHDFDYTYVPEGIKMEADSSSSNDSFNLPEKNTKKRKRKRESADMPKRKKRKLEKTDSTSKKVKDKDKKSKKKDKSKSSKKDLKVKHLKYKKKSSKLKSKLQKIKKGKGEKSVHKKTNKKSKLKSRDKSKHKSRDKSKHRSHGKSKFKS